jgi:hypothetical protein
MTANLDTQALRAALDRLKGPVNVTLREDLTFTILNAAPALLDAAEENEKLRAEVAELKKDIDTRLRFMSQSELYAERDALKAEVERLQKVTYTSYRDQQGAAHKDWLEMERLRSELSSTMSERDLMRNALREIATFLIPGDDPGLCTVGMRSYRGEVFTVVTRKTFDLIVSLKSAAVRKEGEVQS